MLHFILKYYYIIYSVIFIIILFLLIYIIYTQKHITSKMYNKIEYANKITQTMQVPFIAGQWGEIQLKRIAELSGMLQYCEFITQQEIKEGRPDMTILLPNKCVIYVDAKTPVTAYLKSFEDNSNSSKLLKENAKNIKIHISSLSKREYWKTSFSPNITIMFIPTEAVWLSALSYDENLLEYAANNNIIVATPMSLIGLLKTIAFGWENIVFSNNIVKTMKLINEMQLVNKDVATMLTDCLSNNKKQYDKLNKILNLLNDTSINKTNIEES